MSSEIFFTSDTHHDHKNILRFCPARAARWPATRLPPAFNEKTGQMEEQFDVEVMNEGMIERWNDVVKPGDTVYHLGDCSFGRPDRAAAWLRRLHGNIHFVSGNHDKVVHENESVRSMFASIRDYREIRGPDKLKIVLFHFPLVVWNRSHHGAWHLHGHCHNSLPPDGRRVDVGIDSTYITGQAEHRPFHIDEIAAFMKNRKISVHDHHDGMRD